MTERDINTIVKQAIQGNDLPFDRFFEDTFQKLLPKLYSLTKSKEEAQEIFIISMHKFWERFVINQQEVPHNSIGYIYMMCKNAWLLHKKKWNTVEINDTSHKYLESEDTFYEKNIEEREEMDDMFLKHQALSLALEQLSPKCRKLVENELDNTIKLKDLQNDLGFNNYQALVQAKYNCKKKLVQKVHKLLMDLKQKPVNI